MCQSDVAKRAEYSGRAGWVNPALSACFVWDFVRLGRASQERVVLAGFRPAQNTPV
jgi:hypothetical protein